MSKKVVAALLVCVILGSSVTSFAVNFVSRGQLAEGGVTSVVETGDEERSDEHEVDDTAPFDYGSIYDDNGYIKDINALDYVPLFDYEGIRIPSDVHVVTDEALEDEIQMLLDNAGTVMQVTDRVVQSGDLVNIDYVGTIDGIRFEGGSTNGVGTNVEAGVQGQYIGEFLDKIIGIMPGESVTIIETFPDDYHQEDLRGRVATFETVINYIHETEDFDDEFVMDNLNASFGWSTTEEAKIGMREKMSEVYVQNYVQELISTAIKEEVDMESLPAFLIEYYEGSMLQYYKEAAAYYNMDLDAFMRQYVGFESASALIETYYDYNLQDAAYFLIVQAIAKDLNIIITDIEVEEYITENESVEILRENIEYYGIPYLKGGLMYERVFEYIFENVILE